MRLNLILLAAGAVLAAAPAQAEPYTAEQWVRHCTGTPEERGYCTGFVGGVADTLLSCIRTPMTHMEATRAVFAYLEANPSRRQHPAFLVVMRALAVPGCVLPGVRP